VTKQPEKIYIIGAGGHGKVAIRAAQLGGMEVVAVFDDATEKQGGTCCDVPVVGDIPSIRNAPPLPTLIAIGDNHIRLHLARKLELHWATVVHPSAIIDSTAKIGIGVLVLAGAVVQADAILEDHAIINDNATIEHDCHVATGAHVSCNACLAGEASIGKGTMIGIGASILPGICVGDSSVVAAGAVVINNLESHVTAMGVPARVSTAAHHKNKGQQTTMGHFVSSSCKDRIYLSPPHMSEYDLELLTEAFHSNWIAPLGPDVNAFEQEFAEKHDIDHAVALSSGTAALHLALQVVGVKPGDEVLTSSLTFIASANAIRYCGAKPVFIDSDRTSWNIDPNLLAAELHAMAKCGRLPAAVLAVDVFGQCADYESISRLCRQYDVPLIEDAAESLGALYQGRLAGTLADIGCYSFNGNKIITTSGGGMLVTRHSEWANRVRHLSTQARLVAPHYEHAQVGNNYRLSNLLAAVGRGQLRVLDERVNQRRNIFSYYSNRLSQLPGLEFMPEAKEGRATRWLTCLLIDPDLFGASSNDLRLALEAENIESRPAWKPMHLQPVNSDCRVRGGYVSESIFQRGLCLPSGSSLQPNDLDRVASLVEQCMDSVRSRRAG
jgi:sugar O-acyltransferase (sialic acid O-acetyltransferase NeuD family)